MGIVNKISCVYTITNKVNNKAYIGATSNFYARRNKHRVNLKKGTHWNEYLQNEWVEYGSENFSFEVLEMVDKSFLKSQENYWANMMCVHNRQYGYNILPTHPFKMPPASHESRKKISNTLSGRTQSYETKEKRRASSIATWSNPDLRLLKSQQSKELHRLGKIGTKGMTTKRKGLPYAGDRNNISDKIKEHFSDVKKRDDMAAKQGAKKFIVYKAAKVKRGNRWGVGFAEKGEFILEGANLTRACQELGVTVGNARRCMKGNVLSVKGYIFQYK